MPGHSKENSGQSNTGYVPLYSEHLPWVQVTLVWKNTEITLFFQQLA